MALALRLKVLWSGVLSGTSSRSHQSLDLTQRQVECQAQRHARLDCKSGIDGLPAGGSSDVVPANHQAPLESPIMSHCLDAEDLHRTPRILHPKLHLWNVVAPRGVTFTGIDLSPEILVNCQASLRRWQSQAALFLGNAESLAFADESFDVVFGINFFSNRSKAIREMIRVAKPGSKILIADETEEHVQAMYEKGPITSLFCKDRKEPVIAPIDLVPSEMLETHL
jgi:SAM-dependent methyltransferase